jgi:hypothetical protein
MIPRMRDADTTLDAFVTVSLLAGKSENQTAAVSKNVFESRSYCIMEMALLPTSIHLEKEKRV